METEAQIIKSFTLNWNDDGYKGTAENKTTTTPVWPLAAFAPSPPPLPVSSPPPSMLLGASYLLVVPPLAVRVWGWRCGEGDMIRAAWVTIIKHTPLSLFPSALFPHLSLCLSFCLLLYPPELLGPNFPRKFHLFFNIILLPIKRIFLI